MSYIKTNEMVGPVTDDLQVITSFVGDTAITLTTSRGLENPTNTDGDIEYVPSNGSTKVTSFFPAGAYKPISVKTIGSNTTCTKVHVWP